MKLITSGAYLQGEFISEIGMVPPSFLPIGNKRLFEYQIEVLKQSDGDIYLSVPESYEIDRHDFLKLKELGVSVLEVPDNISLADSILYCWNSTGLHYEKLEVLHGDTLFMGLALSDCNAVSCHPNKGFYNRATVNESVVDSGKVFRIEWASEGADVLSGYFKFNNPLFMMKCLLKSQGDFIKACNYYNEKYSFYILKRGDWLDFGHVNSFFKSRSKMTTQRSFNDLIIDQKSVKKMSESNSNKIMSEALWFLNLPRGLGSFTPKLLEYDISEGADFFYKLEYLYLLPISDLFVFGNLNGFSWQTILFSVKEMLDNFKLESQVSSDLVLKQFNSLYLDKTLKRLSEFHKQTGFDLSAKLAVDSLENEISLLELAEYTGKLISPVKPKHIGIIHGDPCFSNLLYDSRTNIIKAIDPRGMLPNGESSILGDVRYDLAKIYHSYIGLYDFIIAGRYSLQKVENIYKIEFDKSNETSCKVFEDIFLERTEISEIEILCISIHLFLSMLPLHQDRPDRQEAFIANALRLYKILKGKFL